MEGQARGAPCLGHRRPCSPSAPLGLGSCPGLPAPYSPRAVGCHLLRVLLPKYHASTSSVPQQEGQASATHSPCLQVACHSHTRQPITPWPPDSPNSFLPQALCISGLFLLLGTPLSPVWLSLAPVAYFPHVPSGGEGSPQGACLAIPTLFIPHRTHPHCGATALGCGSLPRTVALRRYVLISPPVAGAQHR